MHDYIVDFPLFVFDSELLMKESIDSNAYSAFIDPLNGEAFNGWLIKRTQSGYGQYLTDRFAELIDSKDCRSRYYIQSAGYNIGFHKDRGALCSLNILLIGWEDPITFRDFKYNYKIALLNTQQEHAVLSTTTERRLFKISVFDKSFEEVRDVLSSKLSN